jgi:hypothetical protein
MRNNEDDWKRGLACGLFWFPPEETVAVCPRQLRLLISKCKSSINASFQILGYGMGVAGADCCNLIVRHLPPLGDSFHEMRQWTLRQKHSGAGQYLAVPEMAAPTDAQMRFDYLSRRDEACGGPGELMSGMMDHSVWDEIDNISLKHSHDVEFGDMLL